MTAPHEDLPYHDGEDVLRAGLMVQCLTGVDGSQLGVDAEQTHAAGVNGTLQGEGELVALVSIWRQNLDHLGVHQSVFRDGDLIGGLWENGIVVVVVQNCDVDLEEDGGYCWLADLINIGYGS